MISKKPFYRGNRQIVRIFFCLSVLTKIVSRVKSFDKYMILGNFCHWMRNWILIGFFSRKFIDFGIIGILQNAAIKKLQCWPSFQLTFHHWLRIFDQQWANRIMERCRNGIIPSRAAKPGVQGIINSPRVSKGTSQFPIQTWFLKIF